MPTIDVILRTLFEEGGARSAINTLEKIRIASEGVGLRRAAEGSQAFFAALDDGGEAARNLVDQLRQIRENALASARGVMASAQSAEEAAKAFVFLNQAGQTQGLINQVKVLTQEEDRLTQATERLLERWSRLASSEISAAMKGVAASQREALKAALEQSEAYQQLQMSDEQLIAANLEFGDSIEGTIAQLRQQAQALRENAQAAQEAGFGRERVQNLEKTAQAYENVANSVESTHVRGREARVAFDGLQGVLRGTGASATELTADMRRYGVSLREAVLANVEFEGGTQGIIARLKEMSAGLRESAEAAAQSGDALEAASRRQLADQIDGIARGLGDTSQQAKQAQGNIGQFGDAMRDVFDPINRFGFALFLITQNIKTVQMIIGGAFNALEEGAKRADTALAFGRSVQRAGLDFRGYSQELQRAAGNLVDFAVVQRQVNRSVQAGVPGLAEAIPTLLEMARAAALAQGDITQTEEFFTALVDAVVKGQPDMLEQVGIFESMGEASDKFRFSLKELEDRELSAEEKQRALLQAVLDSSDAITQGAEDLESYAEGYVDLRTELTETTGALKTFFGVVASETIGDLNEAIGVTADLSDFLSQSLFGASVVLTAISNQVTRDISNWLNVIGELEDVLGVLATGNLPALRDEAGEAQDALSTLFQEGMGFEDLFEILADPSSVLEDMPEDVRRLAAAFGLVAPAAEEAGSGILNALNPIPGLLEKIRNSAIDAFLARMETVEEEIELTVDLQEAWQDYKDSVEDIEKNLSDTLEDIADDRREKLEDIEEKKRDKVEDINDDLEDKLTDIAEDAQDKREDANEKAAEKREKAERDHQRRIAEIQRRFMLARLSAIIDRDARALFEAEQRKKEELRTENEKHADRLREIEENRKKELEEVNEWEDKQTEDAQEAAQERIEDAREAAEEQREDAIEAAEERRQDAIEAAEERKQDALDAFTEEQRDLLRNYEHKQRIQSLHEAKMTLKQAKELGLRGDDLEEALDNARTEWENYVNFVEEMWDGVDLDFMPPGTGDGGSGGDTGGTGGSGGGDGAGGTGSGGGLVGPEPTCGSVDNFGRAGRCDPLDRGKSHTCPDGQRFTCRSDLSGYYWKSSGVGTNAPTSTGVGSGGTSSFGTSSFGVGGQGQRVRIVVEGDDTLEQIFKSMAYEAVIETIE